jgi:hypothetical protein
MLPPEAAGTTERIMNPKVEEQAGFAQPCRIGFPKRAMASRVREKISPLIVTRVLARDESDDQDEVG